MYEDYINRLCCICGKDKTYIYQNIPDWRKYYDKNGNWDGKSYICYYCRLIGIEKTQQYYAEKRKGRICSICKVRDTSECKQSWFKARKYIKNSNANDYICKRCYQKIYNNLPDCGNNIIKSIANVRNGELWINTTQGIGLIGEAIIAKVRKLDILSIKLDKFNYKLDLSNDLEYGFIQSKFLTQTYGNWSTHFGNVNFDTLFVLCANKQLKNIDRVYAIKGTELIGIHSTTIVKNFSKYDKFEIESKNYNDAFTNIMSFLGNKKKFGISDINEWMKGDN